ncbi:MAG: manganese efflux pump [Oscillospiraceae bacterium]|nr:manganese efflux pump [Oscillospiraceae bacterium]
MSGFELTLIVLAFSMDIFAVAVCKGVGMRRLDLRYVGIFLLTFLPVQIFLLFLGVLLGGKIAPGIAAFDSWVVLLIFAVIGANMVNEGRKDFRAGVLRYGEDSAAETVVLSAASGVNVFAVGVSLALLSADIASAIVLVGVTTLVMSVLGFAAGHLFGSESSGAIVISGGIVIFVIGAEIALRRLIFA